VGLSGDVALDFALDGDAGHMWRQIHEVTADGHACARTGTSCVDWCGHWIGDSVSVTGNLLAGAAVVEEAVQAWLDGTSRPFPKRLLAALEAGQAAGGEVTSVNVV
jgi:uncharacterized Ntn-hydrolase superfamily protein